MSEAEKTYKGYTKAELQPLIDTLKAGGRISDWEGLAVLTYVDEELDMDPTLVDLLS